MTQALLARVVGVPVRAGLGASAPPDPTGGDGDMAGYTSSSTVRMPAELAALMGMALAVLRGDDGDAIFICALQQEGED